MRARHVHCRGENPSPCRRQVPVVNRQIRTLSLLALSASAIFRSTAAAQEYFGRNKVQYETFAWQKMAAPHFDIYFYPPEELVARDGARMAERWYARHSALLSHDFTRFPLIFYADQPDFQQTNVISGILTEGTGGVTEGLRTRVILPFTGSYADNDHVIGHELVHVFQYDIARQSRSGGLGRLESLPLWLIEGMAEYLSLGRNDPLTAMWLRDAVLYNDLPTIKQLTRDPRYFPYRYGQALWAYVGGRWGDQAIAQLYESSLKMGFEKAIQRELGMTSDSLGKAWIAQIRADYAPAMAGRTRPEQAGKPVLVQSRKAGDMNLAPVQSPDGRYVAFFSRRGIFSVDLYVAEVATGKVISRLTSPARDPHFDAVSFLYSAGAWSPDSRKIAYVVYAEGDNEIVIADVPSGRVEQRIRPKGVSAISTLAWSPDGHTLAISGSADGMGDLFLYDLATGQVRRLTNDRYAELHPAFSPDGRTLAFATDRGDETRFDLLTFGKMRLALADVATGAIRTLPALPDAKMINPQWSPDGQSLFFVSDRGGFSDVYRMEVATGALRQVTRLATGVSGISANSPAISVASNGRLLFSVFHRQGYSIFALEGGETEGTPVPSSMIAELRGTANPGLLPPISAAGQGQITQSLLDARTGLPATDDFPVQRYRPRLTLEGMGQPAIGVGTSPFGTQIGGGVSAMFGDLLGNRHLGVALQAQGELRDLGGQVYFSNATRRITQMYYAGHIPYLTGYSAAEPATVNVGGQQYDGAVYTTYLQRVFYDQVGTAFQYPFSQSRRAELNVTGNHVGFNTQIQREVVVGNQVVQRQRTDTTSPPGYTFGTATAALVGDNSFFGYTSPVSGGRYRIEVGPTFGRLNFATALVDMRRYLFMRPVTLAFRGLHYGRYGRDAELLQPLYLGQGTLVRGYQANSFSLGECTRTAGQDTCPEFDRLIGTRIGVVNAELRIPLMGMRDLALIPNSFLPLELAPFVDAGVAWTAGSSPSLVLARASSKRIPVTSAGISLRANLLGYVILEGYYARPFQRNTRGGVFGFNLSPGW